MKPKQRLNQRTIFCIGCNARMNCSLQTGQTIYPSKPKLADLQFWQCPNCGNYVGTHLNSSKPLGYIAPPRLRKLRQEIHDRGDVLYIKGHLSRDELYQALSDKLGYPFHIGKIKSIPEAHRAMGKVNELIREYIPEKDYA